MTGSMFRAALARLGWSYTDAARALGATSRHRVGEWARGERPIPLYIAAHVRTHLRSLGRI